MSCSNESAHGYSNSSVVGFCTQGGVRRGVRVFGIAGFVETADSTGTGRGVGRGSASWTQPVEELAESPRAQGNDEVAKHPCSYELPVGVDEKTNTRPPSRHRTATSEKTVPAITTAFHDPTLSRNFREMVPNTWMKMKSP